MRQKRSRILQSGTVVAVHFFPLRSTHATTQHNSGAKDIIRVRFFFLFVGFSPTSFFYVHHSFSNPPKSCVSHP
jgi:hypothetical protein